MKPLPHPRCTRPMANSSCPLCPTRNRTRSSRLDVGRANNDTMGRASCTSAYKSRDHAVPCPCSQHDARRLDDGGQRSCDGPMPEQKLLKGLTREDASVVRSGSSAIHTGRRCTQDQMALATFLLSAPVCRIPTPAANIAVAVVSPVVGTFLSFDRRCCCRSPKHHVDARGVARGWIVIDQAVVSSNQIVGILHARRHKRDQNFT